MSAGPPSGGRGRWGRSAGVLLVVVGLLLAAAALRPDGGLLGTAATGPVGSLGFVVLLGLGWAALVGRFAMRYREEVRHLDGPTPRADRLREAAMLLLPPAAAAVPVLLLVLRSRAADPAPPQPPMRIALPSPTAEPSPPPPAVPAEVGGGLGVVFVALLVLAVVAAVVLGVVLLLRLRRLRRREEELSEVLPAAPMAESPETVLAEAVDSGRRALTGADARAAVIACYAAMEGSLAASGLPRHAWESPTELLGRVLSDERVDAVGARELTALFREARYSTHPMDDAQVRRARAALDAIAARLADAAPPGAPEATAATAATEATAATATAATGAHTKGGHR
ncbi:DUF4129 domain-containing protein [Kitasatospora sp. NPDC056446]|uniref:DUF4129 domain-containing protein n=1 Tax=Kitasatospora sp. NPDC056446 TaxID=3345819 RepID=UPI00368CF1C1